MRRAPARATRALAAAAVLVCLAGRPAFAAEPPPAEHKHLLALLAVALVIFVAATPSEFGFYLPNGTAQPVIGWSWQAPLPPSNQDPKAVRPHRVVAGVDFLPDAVDARARWRLGYRYDRRYVFAGLAWGFDETSYGWSPEVGVKVLHLAEPGGIDPSLHLLVRGNIASQVSAFRGVTVLLGWNLY
jgi:hypothetical protein